MGDRYFHVFVTWRDYSDFPMGKWYNVGITVERCVHLCIQDVRKIFYV